MNRRIAVVAVSAAAVTAVVLGAMALVSEDRSPEVRSAPTTALPVSTTSTTALVGQPGADGLEDPYFPLAGNGGYDVAHYRLEITWQPETGTIVGATTIEATATHDLSRFHLDLVGLEVASVTVDGVPAAVAREDRELQITPVAAVASGHRFTTTVRYSGVPQTVIDGTNLARTGWHRVGREAFVLAEPVGAATFFPVNDHPSDKATYTFEVTAPADQVVVANGLLVGEPIATGADRRWTYAARDPMASYLVQVAIGDFELVDGGTVGGVTIRHAFSPRAVTAVKTTALRTAEMIDVLDDVYGPFPFEAYGVLVVGARLGSALETQTLTIVGTDVGFTSRGSVTVLVHELAHQWVGNAVTLSTWKDIWLNEGFATYSEWLWTERTGGPTAAQSARAAASKNGLAAPPGDPGPLRLFTPTVYTRGAMTLQALRESIGDDAFFGVLRSWIDEHRYGVASTADFVALAERVSGQPLGDLFHRWLYTPGLPQLPNLRQ